MITFFEHPSKTSNSRQAGRFLCVVAWSLVAFYVLASARAMIPGLCATQAAMDAQCHAFSDKDIIKSAARACCEVPPSGQSPSGKRQPITPAESHCAFCNLLIAHTDPPIGFVMAALPEPVHADQVPLAFQVAQEASRAAAPNRAPPV